MLATIVQSAFDNNTGAATSHTNLASPVTAGNLLVLVASKTSGGTLGIDSASVFVSGFGLSEERDFTKFAADVFSATDPPPYDPLVIGWRVATGDEQNLDIYIVGKFAIFEIANAGSPGSFEVRSLSLQGASSAKSLGAFGTPGDLQIMGINWGNSSTTVATDQVLGSGYTQDMQNGTGVSGLGHPGFIVAHGSTGTTPQVTSGQSAPWGGMAIGITSDTPPTASFTATPTSGNAPLLVAFDSSASTGAITSYAWDFGDGGTDTAANPTHVYVDAGPYTITLTVFTATASASATAVIEALTVAFTPYARDRIIISIRASFTDDSLYNHAIVVGTGNSTHTYYAELSDTDPLSPTRIAAIGDRVFVYESDLIATQDAANMAVQKVFRDNCVISEDIEMDALCNPALEGNDIVGIDEETFSKLNITGRIVSMNIPFSSSRQSIRLGRVINIP